MYKKKYIYNILLNIITLDVYGVVNNIYVRTQRS